MEEMFEDEKYFYLVLELVSGGELFEHLIRNGAYSEQTAASLLRDLAAALRFLHQKRIIHADLKPENLMLSSWNEADARVSYVCVEMVKQEDMQDFFAGCVRFFYFFFNSSAPQYSAVQYSV